jgi:hypothetical protein
LPAIGCEAVVKQVSRIFQETAGKDWVSPARLHVFSVHLQPHDILCLPAFLAFDQAVFDLLALSQ